MNEKRTVMISRVYEKGSDRHQIFIARISGDEIAGSVFQYEIWLNNKEETAKRVTSGDAYHVRRTFINKLLELAEREWKNVGSGSLGDPEGKFFDPALL